MRLTKQTGHAIRILIDCATADEDDLVKIPTIADHLSISRQNAFKIVHLLARAGFVRSMRGPSGGIKLARPANQIRVSDVVRAMEQTDVSVAGDEATARGQTSPLASLFDDALAAFISVLETHTLADLAASQRATDRSNERRTSRRDTAPASRKAARKA